MGSNRLILALLMLAAFAAVAWTNARRQAADPSGHAQTKPVETQPQPKQALPQQKQVDIRWEKIARQGKTPVFEGLGGHTRTVTTKAVEAQLYFDQALAFLYGFNHDEAIRSFEQAAALDPDCAMAWWGVAYANGPHINNPVMPEARAEAAWTALSKAKQAVAGGNPVEQALVDALAQRYTQTQSMDRKPLDEAFAAAMRKVWQAHPGDADVGALFAESMMDLRPWDLWTSDGKPQPGTQEIVSTLEDVLNRNPQHPLALHLYIHAVEASPDPGRADDVADRLRNLQPGLGHMVHMPSHIDVRRGRWPQSAVANERAIAADKTYREKSPKQDFYQLYMTHNHHMLAYSYMMCGQSERAIQAMAAGAPAEWVKQNALIADGFTAMPLEVLVRFGRWDQILSAPQPPDYLPLARSLRHCARAIAYAAKGDLPHARLEEDLFHEAMRLVEPEAVFGNNKAADLLDIAGNLMRGEILYREGQVDEGLGALRTAVELEDLLRYSEPPDWIHPVRHVLGAALLDAGAGSEAETVYRADLAKLPNNGWSLYGLARSLKLQGKDAEAAKVEAQFKDAWKGADIKITSSCLCLPAK